LHDAVSGELQYYYLYSYFYYSAEKSVRPPRRNRLERDCGTVIICNGVNNIMYDRDDGEDDFIIIILLCRFWPLPRPGEINRYFFFQVKVCMEKCMVILYIFNFKSKVVFPFFWTWESCKSDEQETRLG